MDFEEARALGREITELVSIGGAGKQALEGLFQRYQIRDLDDDLRKQAEACEAETLLVLEMESQPRNSTEVIAGQTVARFGNLHQTLECCGELNVLIRKYFSWRGGNSRWGMKEESYYRFELLSHQGAIAWIQETSERSHE